MRKLLMLGVLGLVCAAVPACGWAQTTKGVAIRDPTLSPNAQPTMMGGLTDPDGMRKEIEQAAKDAVIERQKKIAKDMALLMKLTTELKAEAEGMKGDQPTPEMAKKMEEVERLAADIRKWALKKI